MLDLVDDMVTSFGVIPQQTLDCAQLDRICHGRGAMRVHIVDIGGFQPAILQRRLHGAETPSPSSDGAVM